MAMNVPSHSANSQREINVLLADPHHIVRSGIKTELMQYANINIVGETADGTEAAALSAELMPHVILCDLQLRSCSGLDLMRKVRARQSEDGPTPPNVLIFTENNDKQFVFSLLTEGARGYILKSESPATLASGITNVANGHIALSNDIQTLLVDMLRELQYELSTSEHIILQLVAKGNSNAEIADSLDISPGTVSNHLGNIYKKLPSVRSRSEATAWAWINHIVR